LLETLSATQRGRILSDFGSQLKQWKKEKEGNLVFDKELEDELKAKTLAYDSALADFKDLLDFRRQSSADPDYPKKQILKAIETKNQHILNLDQKLENFKSKFQTQEDDYTNHVFKC
jgi:uncharacterized UPF0160 family protein